jgi:hypothetical protein
LVFIAQIEIGAENEYKINLAAKSEADGITVDMFPWTEHVETVVRLERCGSEGIK